MEHPPNFRVIQLPCSGRVSPKFILAAFRKGADGVWVSGCHPGECHYIEGNYDARRKFQLLKNLIEYMGFDPGRLQFSWISSAESTRYVEVAGKVVEAVRRLWPNQSFVKAQAPTRRDPSARTEVNRLTQK